MTIDLAPTEGTRLAAARRRSWRRGQPTGDPKKLDIDVILAAQVLLPVPLSDLILATANVGHLSQFVPAALWTDIVP